MNPNELRELAERVDVAESTGDWDSCELSAAYLREQADRQEQSTPIGWIEGPHGALRANPDYRFQGPQTVAWSFPLYLHPAPPTCIGKDPSCPCQDGDACHYRDSADGTPGWPIPAPADAVEALRELVAYVDEPAGFNAACAADTDSFVAFMDAIEQKRKAIVERARAALAAADQKAAMQRATDVAQDLGLYGEKEPKCD